MIADFHAHWFGAAEPMTAHSVGFPNEDFRAEETSAQLPNVNGLVGSACKRECIADALQEGPLAAGGHDRPVQAKAAVPVQQEFLNVDYSRVPFEGSHALLQQGRQHRCHHADAAAADAHGASLLRVATLSRRVVHQADDQGAIAGRSQDDVLQAVAVEAIFHPWVRHLRQAQVLDNCSPGGEGSWLPHTTRRLAYLTILCSAAGAGTKPSSTAALGARVAWGEAKQHRGSGSTRCAVSRNQHATDTMGGTPRSQELVHFCW